MAAVAAKVPDAVQHAQFIRAIIEARLPVAKASDPAETRGFCKDIREAWKAIQPMVKHWGKTEVRRLYPMADKRDRTIAQGSFGKVKKTRDESKVIKVCGFLGSNLSSTTTHWKSAARELTALSDLQEHKGLTVVLHDVVMGIDKRDRPKLWIVLERERASLSREVAPPNPENLRILTYKLAGLLERLHAAGYVHRDLKPKNILVTAGGDLRLADFGAAVRQTDNLLPHANVCTITFAAPEILLGQREFYDYRAADVWSFAATLWRYAFDSYAHQVNRKHEPILIQDGETGEIEVLRQSMPDRADADFADLLTHCLEPDPDKRYTLSDVFNHRYCVQEPERSPASPPTPAHSGTSAATAHPQAIPADAKNAAPSGKSAPGGAS